MLDRSCRACLPVAALLLAAAATASAQTRLYDPTLSSCTELNCSSTLVQGSLLTYGGPYQAPWTALVWVGLGQCVRVENVSRTGTVRILALHNQGELLTDLGFADPTIPTWYAYWDVELTGVYGVGWHVVVVNGVPDPIETNFTLAIGRYPEANPNCTQRVQANSKRASG